MTDHLLGVNASSSSSSCSSDDDPLLLPHRRDPTLTNIHQVYRLFDDEEEEEKEAEYEDAPQYFSNVPLGSVANLCSATLGAGVLALPLALYQAGFVCGLLLLSATACITIYSIDLLVNSCDYYQLYSYEGLASRVLGRRARSSVEVCMLVFCGGTAVGYLMAVGDICEHVVNRTVAMIAVWCVILVPLSLLPTMASLQGVSGVGVSAIGTLVFGATIHYSTDAGDHHTHVTDVLWPANGMVSVLTACPVVLFAFSCQVNVCAIFDELDVDDGEQTKQQVMKRVTRTAVAICAGLYLAVSMVVVADFGNTTTSNMLSGYTDHTPIMNVSIACMGLAVLLAFPLNIFPARTTLLGLLEPSEIEAPLANETLTEALLSDAPGSPDSVANRDEAGNDLLEEHHDMSQHRPRHRHQNARPVDLALEHEHPSLIPTDRKLHVVSTLFLTGIVLALALLLPNISVVFGLLGGTTSSWLGFCVPGLVGMQLAKSKEDDTGETQWKTTVLSWFLLVAGIVVGILTTGVTVYDTIHNAPE